MALYEVRFLKPDGTYGASVRLDVADDQACKSHVIANWAQKPCEIWRDDLRISRRTSAGYEARLRGDPVQKQAPPSLDSSLVSRWSLKNMARDGAALSASDLQRLEQTAASLFQILKSALAPHPVWVRSENHPQAPAQIDQTVCFSFHPVYVPDEPGQVGSFGVLVSSRERDGSAVLNDIASLVEAAFPAAAVIEGDFGSARIGKCHRLSASRLGLFLVVPLSFDWVLMPALSAAR